MKCVEYQHLIRKLLARDLIRIEGKSNLPGRPNLYVITKEFLDFFGLATIDDLPKFENIVTSNETTELYETIYKEDK